MKEKVYIFGFILWLSIFVFSQTGYGQFIEVYAIGQKMKGDQTKAMDLTLTVGDHTDFGFGAGMNIESVNLNMEFVFGSTELELGDVKLDTKLFAFHANLEYTFITIIVSPFITAGIGSVNFSDSFTQFETLNETNFSYNFGGGIRYVLADHYLIKGMYRLISTKIKDTDEAIQFSGITIQLGYVF